MKKSLFLIALFALAATPKSKADDKIDFASQIKPILESHCIKCHGPEKHKGKLRLDSKAAAMKGGEDGAVIEPGKAEKSDLVRRISLTKDDDDFMPAKGPPLPKRDIDLFKQWINAGAPWPDNLVLQDASKKNGSAEKKTANPAAGASGKIAFAKLIAPIFQDNCLRCHGPEKHKGKLRLDQRDSVFNRPADDLVVIPGHPEKSDLFRRISLPKDDDDFMPKKKDPLSKDQIALIRQWIEQGAEWPNAFTIAAKPGAAAPAPAAKAAPDHKVGPDEEKAIAALQALGVPVRPIAMSLHWYEANLRMQPASAVKAAAPYLAKVAGLVALNLASAEVTDQDLSFLKNLANLTHLHLERTAITDAGLANLENLADLTYLNLYGTAVTDAGVKKLSGLKSLRHLYLWQTKVTENGAKELRAALPEVDVNLGWNLAALQTKSDQKQDGKTAGAKAP